MPGHEVIFLHSKGLGDADIPEVIDIIQGNPNAKSVILSNNQLTDHGVAQLATSLQELPLVIQLALRSNNLTGSCLETLAAQSHLTDLDLSNNNIPAGVIFTSCFSGLVAVDLSGLPLTLADAQLLPEWLQAHPKLLEVDLPKAMAPLKSSLDQLLKGRMLAKTTVNSSRASGFIARMSRGSTTDAFAAFADECRSLADMRTHESSGFAAS